MNAPLTAEDVPAKPYDYRHDLGCWFGLDRNSFAVMPRVLMEAMPPEWQAQMAALLFDYTETWINWPAGSGCRVQYEMHGKLAKMPDWLLTYRYPNREEIERLRRAPTRPCDSTNKGE